MSYLLCMNLYAWIYELECMCYEKRENDLLAIILAFDTNQPNLIVFSFSLSQAESPEDIQTGQYSKTTVEKVSPHEEL